MCLVGAVVASGLLHKRWQVQVLYYNDKYSANSVKTFMQKSIVVIEFSEFSEKI